MRVLGSCQALSLKALPVLLVADGKQGVARSPEVPAAAFLKAFDNTTTALLDDSDVALAHREVLPLDGQVFLEVTLADFESLHFFAQTSELEVHLDVVLVKVLLVTLLDHQPEVLDLTLD